MSKKKILKWTKTDIGYEAKALGRRNVYTFTIYFYDCYNLEISISPALIQDRKQRLEEYELRLVREAKTKAEEIARVLELV